MPDYEGLGVEEVPTTYIHRGAKAEAVNGLVRESVDKLGTSGTWLNLRFSQGGYAAAAAADNPTDGLALSIIVAPGDTEMVEKNLRIMGIRPVNVARMLKGRSVRFLPIVLGGALNAFPEVNGDDFLSDKGRDLVDKAQHMTLPELTEEVTDISGGELFHSKAVTKTLQDKVDEQRLDLMSPKGPVLVLVGDNDTTINREHVKTIAGKWAAANEKVEIRTVADADHNHSLMSSVDERIEWALKQLG